MDKIDCAVCHESKSSLSHIKYKKSPTLNDQFDISLFTNRKIFCCDTCKSFFIHPSINDCDLNNFYEKLYQEHPQALNFLQSIFPYKHSRYLSQAVYLKNLLPSVNKIKVLEIGSNAISSLPSLSFLFKDIQFFYYDQIESPIIKKYGGKRVGTFANAETIDEHFLDGDLDLIYMSHTLEHINPFSLRNLLLKCTNKLRVGGNIFIEVPYELSSMDFFPPHTIFYSLEGIKSLFDHSGYDVVDISLIEQNTNFVNPQHSTVCNTSCLMKKFRFFKKLIYQSIILFFVFIPFLRKISHNLNFLLSLKSLKNPYDNRPYIRLLARKGFANYKN